MQAALYTTLRDLVCSCECVLLKTCGLKKKAYELYEKMCGVLKDALKIRLQSSSTIGTRYTVAVKEYVVYV